MRKPRAPPWESGAMNMNILEAVQHCVSVLESKKVEAPRLSAELLLAYATSMTRAQVLAASNRNLTESEENHLTTLLQRRAHHEPMPYITGEVEFYSLPLSIASGVFIPRPDTETLVDAVLDVAREMDHPPKICDLCTGSGCILIALAMNLEYGEFWGSDVSTMAIQVSAMNVRRYELENFIELREGPLFTPLRNTLTTGFDILVSNPPYIKSSDIARLSSQIREYEPAIALDGGRDGLMVIRSILDGAGPILKPGSYIFLEADPSQMGAIRNEAQRRHFVNFTIHKDAAGRDRVIQFQFPE